MASKRVPDDEIEKIVGTYRDPSRHIVRVISKKKVLYILHPIDCKRRSVDLRLCAYSESFDRYFDENEWLDFADKPVYAKIVGSRVLPRGSVPESRYYEENEQ